jgi:hypothetical protein
MAVAVHAARRRGARRLQRAAAPARLARTSAAASGRAAASRAGAPRAGQHAYTIAALACGAAGVPAGCARCTVSRGAFSRHPPTPTPAPPAPAQFSASDPALKAKTAAVMADLVALQHALEAHGALGSGSGSGSGGSGSGSPLPSRGATPTRITFQQ